MKNKGRYFKVKFGFNVSDSVSIPETELQKVIYAQAIGKPVQIGDSYVNAKNIISITPHWHKHTGWYDWYEPTNGDDFAQIKRDCPDYDGVVEAHKNYVAHLMQTNQINLIGKTIEIPELEETKPTEISAATKILADKFKIDGN